MDHPRKGIIHSPLGASQSQVGRRRSRVLLLSHFYPPEIGAPQTRLRETVRGLVAMGHEVRVVTGPPHYPDGRVKAGYAGRRPLREIIDDVPVLRLPMIPRPNRGFVDRAIDQGSFAAVGMVAVPPAQWADVLLVESPPLFLGFTAAWLRRATGRPYVYHVADPWPDFPVAMGLLENPLARRLAYGLEALAYRHAGLITTVSPGLVDLLAGKRSAAGRVRLLPNGVDVGRFHPGADPAGSRRKLGWPEAALTLVYLGTIGLAQGCDTLVEAIAPLADEGIQLRLIGDGADRETLRRKAASRGLAHIHFDEPVPAEEVPEHLAAADAVAVMLRSGPLYDLSLPTKLVEGLAAGRPIVASAGGDTASLVASNRVGVASRPEDSGALREAIMSLVGADDWPGTGRRARALAEARFDRAATVARLSSYLDEVARSG